MATDGSDPTPCDPDVFREGTIVFMTHTIPSNAMESWVKKVADVSGQRVDWHFACGRACVRALGDLTKVQEALEMLMPEHDALRAKATEAFLATVATL